MVVFGSWKWCGLGMLLVGDIDLVGCRAIFLVLKYGFGEICIGFFSSSPMLWVYMELIELESYFVENKKMSSLVPHCPVCKSVDVKVTELISKRKVIIQIVCFRCGKNHNVKFSVVNVDKLLRALRR